MSDGVLADRLRVWCVHLARIALLGSILLLVHWQHQRAVAVQRASSLSWPVDRVRALFPKCDRLGEVTSRGGRVVLNDAGEELGYVIQTAPESDRFLGFSGPTNCLVGFDPQNRITGIIILASHDTRDHVDLILRKRSFLKSWNGKSWEEAAAATDIDGVAGATLTSVAIAQGLQRRLGAAAKSLKFPKPLTVDDARMLFSEAADVQEDAEQPSLWRVLDGERREAGLILRTSPAADEVVGFQGPTETRIGIRLDGQIVGVVVGASYDNEPYVTYVRDDQYFRSLFTKYKLPELAELDLERAKIEGVSGATMTSLAVARGIVKAASEQQAAVGRPQRSGFPSLLPSWRTAATLVVIMLGIVIGLTPLRGRPWLRISFQVVLIAYLGLANGELLSLAMFAGWAQSGIPWSSAAGLFALSAAAIALPIARGQNVYCSHLCPHGAVQQLLPRRWKLRRSLPPWLSRGLRLIRPLLLAWALIVSLGHWSFSLVDIEAFDAYSWRAAAWPTFVVAIVGLVASLFVPMAYCRHGCPTGALLEYLRRHRRRDRLTRADLFAAACFAMGVIFFHSVP